MKNLEGNPRSGKEGVPSEKKRQIPVMMGSHQLLEVSGKKGVKRKNSSKSGFAVLGRPTLESTART